MATYNTLSPDALVEELIHRLEMLEKRLNQPAAPVLDSLLTAEQLADRLGHKNTRTIDEWRVRGKGPKYVRVGRAPMYPAAEIDAWLLSRVFKSTSEEVLA